MMNLKMKLSTFVGAVLMLSLGACEDTTSSTPSNNQDLTAPTISATVPIDSATNVSIGSSLAVTFSEAMNPESVNEDSFLLRQGSNSISGTVIYTGVTATFRPASVLTPGTVYSATITDDVLDLAGNSLAQPYEWSFTTGVAPDTTAPTVSSTVPPAAATGVAFNSNVSVIFSEAMDPATITSESLTLSRGSTTVPGTVTYAGVTATFNPTGDLDESAEYTATVTTGAKDLSGNPLAASYVWTFTTGSTPDTTAPTVSSTIPASSATGVALSGNIAVTFSEPMDPLTISTATIFLKAGTVQIAGTVTQAGVTATFNPSTDLEPSTVYTATVTTGAKDLAGNPLAETYEWSFTTGSAPDTTAPTVSSTVPASSATGVALSGNIAVTFSEPMDPMTISTATIILRAGTEQVAGTVTHAGVTATFSPSTDLEPSTTYIATVTAEAKDLAGNPLAEAYEWSFTTGLVPDATAPTVSSTVPVNTAIDVALGGNLAVTFSEPMDPLTISTTTILVRAGTVQIVGTVTYAGVTATFNPSTDLQPSTTYTATVTTGATDLAGNSLAMAYEWSFTTGLVPDTTAPSVSSTIPQNSATGVPLGSSLSVIFSEPMDPASINTTTLLLSQGTTTIAGTVTFSGVTATFAPSSALDPSTVYTATVTTGVRDLAGNALAAIYTWSFTTGLVPDTTAPMISSTVPADGSTDVSLNGNLSITFSEAMDPLTINTVTVTLMDGNTAITGTVTLVGVTATFNPDGPLAPNTTYTATITTGVKDLAGNPLTAEYVWSFTTGSGPDIIAPTVISTFPAHQMTGSGTDGNISITFSEAMNPLTITTSTVTLREGINPIAGTVSYGGVTGVFTPTNDLDPTTLYTATVTTAVTDLAGNAMEATYTWTFTTGENKDEDAPSVLSTIPADLAIGVSTQSNIIVTFDEVMAPLTLNSSTLTLRQGNTPIFGTVTSFEETATFNPNVDLAPNTTYTATVTTGAEDLAGNPLADDYVWTFTTAAPLGPDPVNLGLAGDYVILSKAGIDTVPGSIVTGHIGVSPIDSTAITGFSLMLDSTTQFATSTQVVGQVHAADYADPTPANLTTAISNMETAYTDAAGRSTPDFTELGGGEIGGLTLAPGLYKWGTDLLITTDVTLSGGPNDVWIFQIAGGITQANGARINLSGGALAKNIFWQTFGQIEIGTTAHFEGIALCQTAIIIKTGATANGRLLSQTAVTLDQNAVTQPAP